MIHENIELTGSFIVSGSFVLPNHPNTGSVSALTGSVYNDTTDNILKVYTGNSWVTVGEQTAPVSSVDIEYLLVAGGGGAAADSGGGAGGGAGGLLSSSISGVESGSSFTITVGGGGAGYVGGTSPAGEGTDSSIAGATISTITATGGGGAGSSQDTGTIYLGHDGGSGGGSGNGNANYTRPDGGSGTVGQGNDGGGAHSAAVNNGNNAAGGGGGAGAVGADATSGAGGNGGDGLQSSITGTSTYYAGGGAGGTRSSGTAGTGGQGGGGNANNTTDGTGQDGDANTGGGAGGSRSTPTAAGGSGVVILAYPTGSHNGAGGITGTTSVGKKYHQFNSTDTFKLGSSNDFQVVTDSMTVHLDAGNYSSRGTSTWTDLSGDSNNATISGATLGQNWYYDFDGSNDYGTFNSGVTGAPLTYEVWLRPDVVNSYQYALMLGTAAGTGGGVISLSIYNANSTFYIYDGSSVHVWSNDSISASTWVHACVSVTGTTASRYLNGSLQGTSTVASLSLAEASDIGYYGYGPNYYLNGQIAQLRIYNKALSATEVLQNYNATKTNFV